MLSRGGLCQRGGALRDSASSLRLPPRACSAPSSPGTHAAAPLPSALPARRPGSARGCHAWPLLFDRRAKEGPAFAKELCRHVEAPFGFACAGERVAHLLLQGLPVGGRRRRRGLQLISSFLPVLAGRCMLTFNAFAVGPCRDEFCFERVPLDVISLRETLRLRLLFAWMQLSRPSMR